MQLSKERLSGVDLAKVVAMFFVVAIHVANKGLSVSTDVSLTPVFVLISSVVRALLLPCVDIFAIASGYVGICSDRKCSRVLLIWLQMIFIGLVSVGITSCLCPDSVFRSDWIHAAFPIVHDQYWYLTLYIPLAILQPVINNGIKNLSKEKLRDILLVFLGLICAATMFGFDNYFGVFHGFSFLWLLLLYLLGAYWRLYGLIEVSKKISLLLAGALILISACFNPVLHYVLRFVNLSVFSLSLSGYTGICTFGLAMVIFDMCKNVSIKWKGLPLLSKLTLGIFIIHTQPVLRRQFINPFWNSFDITGIDVWLFLLVTIAAGLFAASAILDLLRYWLFRLFRVRQMCETIDRVLS